MDETALRKLTDFGMDVTGTMARFGGNEALMMRFLLGFPKDQTMGSLRDAMASGDREAQKVAAHSLKGLSGNLGLTPVFEASTAMMNALRASEDTDVTGLYEALDQAYQAAIDMIATLS
ncbi:MAG: Hpt domain-containing protein [Clostridia bacterium]|nr:Hpt domain-containing protein [Clostridia bacterium]